MDDQHRQPRDGDRNPVRDRIRRAVAAGRISEADGQIRLTNVTSAQSVGELGLIVRDLDQLEAVIQPGSPVAVPVPAGSLPGPGAVVTAVSTGVRRTVPLLILGLAISIIAAGVIGLVVFSSSGGSGEVTSSNELPDPLPISPSTGVAEPGEEPGGEPEQPIAPTPYRLNAAGFKLFLADYRREFSTSKVVDLTFYDAYVIVRVPIPGTQRNTGWRYADGTFDEFGAATANFPGSAVFDTAKLDLAKLVRNIRTALRTLDVEDGQVSHIGLNYRSTFDEAPNVNIYVTNAFSESGYLATTLDGRIERSYPFGG